MNQKDWNQRRIEAISKKPYLCTKCSKEYKRPYFHFYGDIWENHKKYKAEPKPFEKIKTIETIYAPRRDFG